MKHFQEDRVETSIEYDHTIMTQIISIKQFHAMIDKLTEELIPTDTRGLVPVAPQVKQFLFLFFFNLLT